MVNASSWVAILIFGAILSLIQTLWVYKRGSFVKRFSISLVLSLVALYFNINLVTATHSTWSFVQSIPFIGYELGFRILIGLIMFGVMLLLGHTILRPDEEGEHISVNWAAIVAALVVGFPYFGDWLISLF